LPQWQALHDGAVLGIDRQDAHALFVRPRHDQISCAHQMIPCWPGRSLSPARWQPVSVQGPLRQQSPTQQCRLRDAASMTALRPGTNRNAAAIKRQDLSFSSSSALPIAANSASMHPPSSASLVDVAVCGDRLDLKQIRMMRPIKSSVLVPDRTGGAQDRYAARAVNDRSESGGRSSSVSSHPISLRVCVAPAVKRCLKSMMPLAPTIRAPSQLRGDADGRACGRESPSDKTHRPAIVPAAVMLSSRSIAPPCPGIIAPVSLTPKTGASCAIQTGPPAAQPEDKGYSREDDRHR
jgi:hypothetical protein